MKIHVLTLAGDFVSSPLFFELGESRTLSPFVALAGKAVGTGHSPAAVSSDNPPCVASLSGKRAARPIGQPVKVEVRQVVRTGKLGVRTSTGAAVHNPTVIARMTRRQYGISHPHA